MSLTDLYHLQRRDLAGEITKRKAASGFTYREIANKTGVHIVTVQRWANGKRYPSLRELKLLDKLLIIR